MPDLLHEYWENETGGEFSPVRERTDNLRPALVPNATLRFSFWASSWYQAMQLYQEHLDYGDFYPPKSDPDHFYTEEEVAEQEAYLLIRGGG